MTNEISVRLPSGVTLTGPFDKVVKAAKGFGTAIKPEEFYFSASRQEYVRISEMNTVHLRNATLKMYAEWVEELRVAATPAEFINLVRQRPTDPVLINVLSELATRGAWS